MTAALIVVAVVITLVCLRYLHKADQRTRPCPGCNARGSVRTDRDGFTRYTACLNCGGTGRVPK